MSKTYYLGIDIGGMTAKLGLFRVEASLQPAPAAPGLPAPELIGRSVIPTRTENAGKQVIADTALAARELAESHQIPFSQIAGAGIGVPGPVLPATAQGTPVVGCVNLGWTDTRYLDREFRELSGIEQVCVMNDANAAALGELYFGGATAASIPESAVMVTIGTGIGGGIIQGGRIVTGNFGAGGEFGHMPVNPDHPLLRTLCEQDPSLSPSADLEYYVSATGLVRIGSSALHTSKTPSTLRSGKPLVARDIIDAAKAGDALAISVMDFFFDTFGKGLACVSTVVDPQLFIIGGGVSAAGDYLLDGLQKAYREHAFHASKNTSFRLAVLGNDAGLLGPLVPLLLN